MDEATVTIVEIVGPILMLIVIVWVLLRNRASRSDRETQRAETGTRNLYAEEETRRREGTDDL